MKDHSFIAFSVYGKFPENYHFSPHPPPLIADIF